MELTRRLAALLSATEIEELGGGHQSRVFRVVRRGGEALVAKVQDATMVGRRDLDARTAVAVALAAVDPQVCRPLPIGGQYVTEVALAEGATGYVTCLELAEGVAPDPSDPADADRMGRALAQLHRSMSRLPPAPLPFVAPLRTGAPSASTAGGPHQLLHGDFNVGNLRQTDDVLRIFDFDDCGYGPPTFDVANALYMVLFDSVVGEAPETYRTFRDPFVSGYVATSSHPIADDVVDRLVDLRVDALRRWLDDLDTAPVGIRTASSDWLATLRSFVAAQP